MWRSTSLLLLLSLGCTPGKEEGPTDRGAPEHDSGAPDSGHGGDSGGDTATPIETVSPGLDGLAETGAHNVVVIQVDTLRADRLPFYGGTNDTMPRTRNLPWLVVERLYAASSWTLPSSVSLLTGLYPANHGVTHVTASGAPARSVTAHTAARVFADDGYATMVLSGNGALQMVEGVFDDFDDFDPLLLDGYGTNLGWEVADTLAWIDALPAGTPFYVHLQPMNVHLPYHPDDGDLGTFSNLDDPPFDVTGTEDEQIAQFRAAYDAADDAGKAELVTQLRDVYDEDVLGIDSQVKRLVTELSARGLLRDTLIVLTGDHGETLAEEETSGHVFFGHGGKVRQELVHVPLLIYNPALPMNNRVECLAGNVDTMPTLLRAVGLPDMEGVDGQALQDGCRDFARSSVYAADTDDEALTELGVTDGIGSLRWDCSTGTSYRYDLSTDPTATTSVPADDFDGHAILLTYMEDTLDAIRTALGPIDCQVE